ncbi:methyltransferase domain-containing protein [Hymenobacter rubripertinctus]|uniref:tRNA1(Val) (adenine(37)-N6)-methyltransferase n=2 Tax=Hymenobacter rubripertinctus TaxID=2029981 RepID=A0A418R7M4_9BACT|nr:methyltransferase domain-containing protein [Hymenobacter rubripertinctus]
MKVCTDACVLGALAAVEDADRILDIGAGTGLLALMAAQRNPAARIEAVELDEAAAAQAAANFGASPWAGRLTLHAGALAALAATAPRPFDHILCNPPFFRNALRSPDARRTQARHAAPDTLSFAELARFAADLLTNAGRLTVLLPPPEMREFEQEAARAGLFPLTRLVLHHRATSKPLRHITAFGRAGGPVTETAHSLYASDSDAYSAWFRERLGPFYLAL